jgi:hypothetical protein
LLKPTGINRGFTYLNIHIPVKSNFAALIVIHDVLMGVKLRMGQALYKRPHMDDVRAEVRWMRLNLRSAVHVNFVGIQLFWKLLIGSQIARFCARFKAPVYYPTLFKYCARSNATDLAPSFGPTSPGSGGFAATTTELGKRSVGPIIPLRD